MSPSKNKWDKCQIIKNNISYVYNIFLRKVMFIIALKC